MVQPLRRAHFWIWIALAIALPAVCVAALAARRPATPVNPSVHWEKFK